MLAENTNDCGNRFAFACTSDIKLISRLGGIECGSAQGEKAKNCADFHDLERRDTSMDVFAQALDYRMIECRGQEDDAYEGGGKWLVLISKRMVRA